MKKFLGLMLIVIVAGLCIAGKTTTPPAPVPEPNSLEARKIQVEGMVKELPNKERELKTKEYAGTIEQIFAERITDVNHVLVFTKDIDDKAVQVCDEMGLQVEKKQAIKTIMDDKKSRYERQKQNNEIMKAVIQIVTDPNALPPPDDPNYAAEVQRNQEFMLIVMEMCNPV